MAPPETQDTSGEPSSALRRADHRRRSGSLSRETAGAARLTSFVVVLARDTRGSSLPRRATVFRPRIVVAPLPNAESQTRMSLARQPPTHRASSATRGRSHESPSSVHVGSLAQPQMRCARHRPRVVHASSFFTPRAPGRSHRIERLARLQLSPPEHHPSRTSPTFPPFRAVPSTTASPRTVPRPAGRDPRRNLVQILSLVCRRHPRAPGDVRSERPWRAQVNHMSKACRAPVLRRLDGRLRRTTLCATRPAAPSRGGFQPTREWRRSRRRTATGAAGADGPEKRREDGAGVAGD